MYSTEKRSSCRDRLRIFGAKLAFLGRYSIFSLSNIALDREHSARAFSETGVGPTHDPIREFDASVGTWRKIFAPGKGTKWL
jgi:hypothetical protein